MARKMVDQNKLKDLKKHAKEFGLMDEFEITADPLHLRTTPEERVFELGFKLQLDSQDIKDACIDIIIEEIRKGKGAADSWDVFKNKFLVSYNSARSKDPRNLPDMAALILTRNPTADERMALDNMQAIFDDINSKTGGMLKIKHTPKNRKLKVDKSGRL